MLTRVVFDVPTPEGAGFFCALAVPATDEAAAHRAALAKLDAEGCQVSVMDTRPLSDEEARDLSGIHPLGDRIFFQEDGS